MISITESSQCCGCTACQSICVHGAITMISDKEGFNYPFVDKLKCVECRLCEKVCPILYRTDNILYPNQKALYAARLKDVKALIDSSSGGMFYALAYLTISRGGIVCGVEYSSTMEVRHAFAETMKDCKKFQGSKYVQSNMEGIYFRIKSYLKEGRYVLFTGTPCQVEGLNLFLRKSYDNLLTVDLVCHAVPSPKLFQDYVSMINRKMNSKLISISMRYKRTRGWGRRYSYCFFFNDGRSVCDPINISNWGKLFFSQLINRPSCHDCKFTNLERPGDFTIADFWDDANKRPELHSNTGTSLFLVNSGKGLRLLDILKRYVDLWPITQQEAMQPCLECPTKVSPKREHFWRDYELFGFRYVYWKYFTDSYYIYIKKHIKKMLLGLRVWKTHL